MVDTVGSMTLFDVRTMEPVQTIMGNISKNGKAVAAAYDPQTAVAAIASNVAGLIRP